jgi:hypothetical protein
VIPFRNNFFLVGGVVAVQFMHLIAMHIPILNQVLDIRPVSFETWIVSALSALSIIMVMEIYKLYLRFGRRDPLYSV